MVTKKIKKTIIFVLSLFLVAYIGYQYLYGGARDVASETVSFEKDGTTIYNEFSTNTEIANKKYLEKVVAIFGVITSIKDSVIIIDKSVVCHFNTKTNSAKENDSITIKGRVVGFDDLMEELNLDNCSLIKK